MSPPTQSALTSILLVIISNLVQWAVAHGYITASDGATIASALIVLIPAGAIPLLIWFKSTRVSPTNLIRAVNQGENGVKVVPVTSPETPVDRPLRGPGSAP